MKVVYGVKSEITPTLEEWNLDIDMDYVNSFLGTNITKKLAGELLLKMGLSMKICEDGNRITVRVPPTRRDIISESDIVEDIAIAYGYKNIKSLDCPAMEVGSQQQSYRFSSKLRNLLAIAGYIEVLTFALVRWI